MRIVHDSVAGRVQSTSATPGRATPGRATPGRATPGRPSTSGRGRTDSDETSDDSESDEDDDDNDDEEEEEDDDEEEEEDEDDDDDEEEEEEKKKNSTGPKEIYYCDVCGKKETKFPDLVYHRSVEHSFATGKDDGHKFMRSGFWIVCVFFSF